MHLGCRQPVARVGDARLYINEGHAECRKISALLCLGGNRRAARDPLAIAKALVIAEQEHLVAPAAPPAEPPNWFCLSGSRSRAKKFRASSLSLRRNSYSVPCNWLVPDLVMIEVFDPLVPPYSGGAVCVRILNSSMAYHRQPERVAAESHPVDHPRAIDQEVVRLGPLPVRRIGMAAAPRSAMRGDARRHRHHARLQQSELREGTAVQRQVRCLASRDSVAQHVRRRLHRDAFRDTSITSCFEATSRRISSRSASPTLTFTSEMDSANAPANHFETIGTYRHGDKNELAIRGGGRSSAHVPCLAISARAFAPATGRLMPSTTRP